MGGRESRAETVSESFSCNSIISSSPVCVCVCVCCSQHAALHRVQVQVLETAAEDM